MSLNEPTNRWREWKSFVGSKQLPFSAMTTESLSALLKNMFVAHSWRTGRRYVAGCTTAKYQIVLSWAPKSSLAPCKSIILPALHNPSAKKVTPCDQQVIENPNYKCAKVSRVLLAIHQAQNILHPCPLSLPLVDLQPGLEKFNACLVNISQFLDKTWATSAQIGWGIVFTPAWMTFSRIALRPEGPETETQRSRWWMGQFRMHDDCAM